MQKHRSVSPTGLGIIFLVIQSCMLLTHESANNVQKIIPSKLKRLNNQIQKEASRSEFKKKQTMTEQSLLPKYIDKSQFMPPKLDSSITNLTVVELFARRFQSGLVSVQMLFKYVF